MAAFTGTPTSSVQHALQSGGTSGNANVSDVGARLRIAFFEYTHTATEGSGTGEVNLCVLPYGRIRVYGDLSRIVASAMATDADLHIGHRAYTNLAGTAVAEDDNAFSDNLDAASAIDAALALPAEGFLEMNSQAGITVFAMIDTGNIEATDTIKGWIAYTNQD
jgi:hypothetical protein|tara:strand:+ start:137 stop:628 length:492 start_codon:yes stop_codon:yes gene_type:complete